MTDLSMTRGNTAIIDTTVHYLQASGLTGYSAWFTAKRDAADPDVGAVFQKQIGSGMSAGSATPGTGIYTGFFDAVLTTTVVPADTETLPAGYAHTLVWDVKVKDGSNIETTVDSGALTVLADVTQAI